MSVKCPQCTHRVTKLHKMSISAGNVPLNLQLCRKCCKTISAISGASYESSGKSNRSVDSKLNSMTLPQDEIARTQALKPTVRYSGRARELDSVDGNVQRCFVISSGGSKMQGMRYDRINRQLSQKFNGKPYQIVSDDPMSGEVIARAI